MSNKTYLCNSCGRWNEDGKYIKEDGLDWWTCTPCVKKESKPAG